MRCAKQPSGQKKKRQKPQAQEEEGETEAALTAACTAGTTPLYIASQEGVTPLRAAMTSLRANWKVVGYLFAEGRADVNTIA
jgi:hypothetical protein